ncbi:hypothetical protein Q9R20_09085 [Microbacterium sp. PRF11]|jgi:hypothetical protein|nr:hypothetical protein [Microbacterium sp. PRF11]MDT0117147.1 hypothetical protein [Microbacterium sp. PRF11]
MVKIRLDAPSLQRDLDVDDPAELLEAEGLTWVRDGEADGLPRYVPAASG